MECLIQGGPDGRFQLLMGSGGGGGGEGRAVGYGAPGCLFPGH